MREPDTIRTDDSRRRRTRRNPPREHLALAVIGWPAAPDRVGELLLAPAPSGTWIFGRGAGPASAPRVLLSRQRPGATAPAEPATGERLSREQLALTWDGDALLVRGLGQRALLAEGRPVVEAEVRPGLVLEVDRELLLLGVRRPPTLPALSDRAAHPFGGPDADGIVGESPAAWELRRRLDFVARRREHALITGPSGAGKELVAAALHRRSPFAQGPWVSRNAATIPESLVDAELFGNCRGYPNPGMPDREGLVGAAHGGTLFLDEFAELPPQVQAHLLRVLDAGEYQRLGETTTRRARFRLLAATNRPESALKHDVLARLTLRVPVPGLEARREDIPLLVRHLLGAIAATEPDLRRRFFQGEEPRLSLGLIGQLVRWPYTAHARELRALLWRALSESPGDTLEPLPEPPAPAPAQDPDDPPELEPWVGRPAAEIPASVLQAALDQHGGVQEKVWRALGLESRYQLKRLIRRHGLVVRKYG